MLLTSPQCLLVGWQLIRKRSCQLAISLICALNVGWQLESASAVDLDARNFDLPGIARPVEVRVSFHLLDLQGIDDEAETFEFSGILTLQWKDERQAFDPAALGVAEKFYHGNFQFNELSPSWYPQVILANASSIPSAQGVLLRVSPDGTCTLNQDFHAVARKELQLRRYPFDRQRLEAVFQVLGFDRSQVLLVGNANSATADTAGIRVPQWHLRSITGDFREIDAPYHPGTGKSAAFVFSLEVHRQSFYVVRLVILPLLIIVTLSWCVFWMNRDSLAERMSVTFVGLLTSVAYQSLLGDIMPHISYITFVNAFISLGFILMGASAAINLLVCLYDRNGKHALGELIDRRSRWGFPIAYAALTLLAFVATFYLL